MESYEKIKKVLALGFMNFLDENKPKDKMCLSNGECADIEKAFNEQDWSKLERYLDKYTESEDERIRKAIVATIEQCPDDFLNPKNRDRMLTYLEKQKEPTPADGWDYVDKRMSHPLYWEGFEAGRAVERELSEFEKQKEQKPQVFCEAKAYDFGYKQGKEDAIKEQKPAEWSEEDKRIIKGIIGKIDHDQTYGVSKDEMLNFLKKL